MSSIASSGSRHRRWDSLPAAALLRRAMTLSLPRFLLVGSAGLLTDMTTFSGVSVLGAPDALARSISIGIATFATWQLNRRFTFTASGRPVPAEALRYVAVALCAQGFNLAVFLALRSFAPALPALTAIGIAAAMAAGLSFAGQCLVTFRARLAGKAPEFLGIRP